MEEHGIPTITMSSCYDITQAVKPPRAVFLDFPLGHTTGKPNDATLQMSIVKEALTWGVNAARAGEIHILPHRWSENEDWREKYY